MINPEEISKTNIFFITGRPRSGTTLLWALFEAHPNIIIPFECTFIIDLYPKYGKCRQWDKKTIESFYNDLINQPLLDFWHLDLKSLKEKLLGLPSDIDYNSLCKFIYTQFHSILKKDTIQCIGDKNPIYTIHINRLAKIFPEAKFIHITRDYRDQIASMLNVNFEKPVIASLAYRWKYFNRTVRRFSDRNPEKVFFLKYEDLVTQPKDTMSNVFRFLGVPYTDSIFDFYRIKDQFIKTYTRENIEKYHKELFQPINQGRIGIWEKKLSVKDVKKIESVIRTYAEKSGYPRMNEKAGFACMISTIPGKIFGKAYYFVYRIIYQLPVGIKRRLILRMDRSLKK